MADYIPSSDAAFNAWQASFIMYANATLASLGLVARDLTAILAALSVWQTALPNHVTAAASATAARATKDAARVTLEQLIRPLVRRLQASPQVDDPEQASLGITIPDPTGSHVPRPARNRIHG